jgi:hypothetical protein
MANDSTQDPPVGYGNPPRHARFKPGESGNPSGRPKRVRSLRAELLDELGELTRFGGSDAIELTKARAIVKALVQAAVDGNLRAVNTLLTFFGKGLDDTEEPYGEGVAREGSPIVEAYRRRETRLRSDAGEADIDSSAPQSNGSNES